ncbi:MAG: photosynthetic reaction center cytochrome c subunit [Myxococcaceae bacterium]|nr:photosynthetic reaction center cytochrome c subunit [Myxococcaceae bacterium]
MRKTYLKALGALLGVALTVFIARTYHRVTTVQRGYPGLAMEVLETNVALEKRLADNKLPFALPPAPPGGALAVDTYQNVQVLGHLTTAEVTRLMTAMTLWVAPAQGCAYCHAPQRDEAGNIKRDEDGLPLADPNKLGSDELYTKQVARRMLQMTMHINQDWKNHVQDTGVTCYTCHRGQPVPPNIWFNPSGDPLANRALGGRGSQNSPSKSVGYTSLPADPFSHFLVAGADNIRVQTTTALPGSNPGNTKKTEATYGLMMHFSDSLAVNCTYCHNSNSWSSWPSSPLARGTAWYGIRMVRDLNSRYLEPLAGTFPPERLGPTGDGPKLNCATCHNQAFKPLLGQSMLKDYVVLAEAKPQPAKTVVPEPAPEPSVDNPEPAASEPAPGPPGPGSPAPGEVPAPQQP